jgi:hypothetical protein
MGQHQVFVAEIQSRSRDGTGDHPLRTFEEVLVVRIAGGAVGEHQGRLTAAARTSAALGIVRRCWGDVAHVDHVELGDVDAELHGRGAEQHRELGGAERVFALNPGLVGNLSGVLARVEALGLEGDGAVEGLEELIGLSAPLGCVRDADGIMERLGAVARHPAQGGGRNLIPLDLSLRIDRRDDAGGAQDLQ